MKHGFKIDLTVVFLALNAVLFAALCFFIVKTANDYKKISGNAVQTGKSIIYHIGSKKLEVGEDTETDEKSSAEGKAEGKKSGESKASAPAKSDANVDQKERAKELGLAELKVAAEVAALPTIKNDPFTKDNAIKKPLKPDASVAIILSGLGINESVTARAFDLPPVVGFSFSPYSKNLAEYVKRARLLGHEVYLDFAAQTDKYPAEDYGPYSVLVSKPAEENIQRLKSSYKGLEGLRGLLLPANEDITTKQELMTPILESFKENNLALIYKDKGGNRYMRGQSGKGIAGITLVPRYSIIGEDLAQEVIDSELTIIHKSMAEKQGDKLVVMPASIMGINRLVSWIKLLNKHSGVIKPPSNAAIPFDE